MVIDAKTVEKYRWPWKRESYCKIFNYLNSAQPKIIIHDAIITTLDKENIVIAGPDKELKNIDSLSIDSEIVVSASDIMSGVMLKTVSVSQYLPSTVVAVSGFETLTATVKFVETESATVDIDYSSIDIHGKAKIEPLQSSVSFSVIAKAGEMPSDVEKNIKVSFDTSGLSAGAQEVKLTTVCNDVRLLNNATLYLNIIKEG